MSKVEVYNDKIIRHEDGWGYKVTEGDVGEIVIFYFEEKSDGTKFTETVRFGSGLVAESLGQAIIDKSREMEACFPKSGIDNTGAGQQC